MSTRLALVVVLLQGMRHGNERLDMLAGVAIALLVVEALWDLGVRFGRRTP